MPDLALSDKYRQEEGTIFLTGVEAILRLLLDKQRGDRDAGRAVNQTYVTGYEGSPLGGLDLKVIEQLDAFVASRWFLLAGGYLPEAVVVRMGLPEAFRLRDSRPILYQRNGYWWILLSAPGPLAYEIEEGADRELLAKTSDDKRPDERSQSGTLLTDDPYAHPWSAWADTMLGAPLIVPGAP